MKARVSLPAFKMKILMSVCLFAVCLPFIQSNNLKALNQFRRMILSALPDSWPILDYSDYGCYCGFGGSGTPVDDLDRCCKVHDECYGYAQRHPDCTHFWENPYTKYYKYSHDIEKQVITCGDENDRCARFICECDRRAAECFAASPWIPEHQHLPSHRCR